MPEEWEKCWWNSWHVVQDGSGFHSEEVELPRRSSSRRQKPGSSLVSTSWSWQMKQLGSWAEASWCVFSPWLSFPRCGAGQASPAPSSPSPWPWSSSSSVHLKAAERLLLQLLQAREEKSFLPGTIKQAGQAKPNWTVPQSAWAVRPQKFLPKRLKTLSSPDPHRPWHTAITSGHKAEAHWIDYYHKSLQNNYSHSTCTKPIKSGAGISKIFPIFITSLQWHQHSQYWWGTSKDLGVRGWTLLKLSFLLH